MPDREPTVPPLVGEDHVCIACDLSYAELTVPEAVSIVAELPPALRAAVAAVPLRHRPVRPDDTTWSVAEYVCHLRDVMMTATLRLHRTVTEDRPVVDPMFNDLRAHRFDYAHADVDAVVEQVDAAVVGFLAEVECVSDDQWDRLMVRRDREARTARWLVRQAAHEARHHESDVVTVGDIVAAL